MMMLRMMESTGGYSKAVIIILFLQRVMFICKWTTNSRSFDFFSNANTAVCSMIAPTLLAALCVDDAFHILT